MSQKRFDGPPEGHCGSEGGDLAGSIHCAAEGARRTAAHVHTHCPRDWQHAIHRAIAQGKQDRGDGVVWGRGGCGQEYASQEQAASADAAARPVDPDAGDKLVAEYAAKGNPGATEKERQRSPNPELIFTESPAQLQIGWHPGNVEVGTPAVSVVHEQNQNKRAIAEHARPGQALAAGYSGGVADFGKFGLRHSGHVAWMVAIKQKPRRCPARSYGS